MANIPRGNVMLRIVCRYRSRQPPNLGNTSAAQSFVDITSLGQGVLSFGMNIERVLELQPNPFAQSWRKTRLIGADDWYVVVLAYVNVGYSDGAPLTDALLRRVARDLPKYLVNPTGSGTSPTSVTVDVRAQAMTLQEASSQAGRGILSLAGIPRGYVAYSHTPRPAERGFVRVGELQNSIERETGFRSR